MYDQLKPKKKERNKLRVNVSSTSDGLSAFTAIPDTDTGSLHLLLY